MRLLLLNTLVRDDAPIGKVVFPIFGFPIDNFLLVLNAARASKRCKLVNHLICLFCLRVKAPNFRQVVSAITQRVLNWMISRYHALSWFVSGFKPILFDLILLIRVCLTLKYSAATFCDCSQLYIVSCHNISSVSFYIAYKWTLYDLLWSQTVYLCIEVFIWDYFLVIASVA